MILVVCIATLICHIRFFHPGLGVGSVQVQLDHALANKLRISRIPSIVGVINGKLHHFGGKWGLYEIRDFIRSMFPSDLITQVRSFVFVQFPRCRILMPKMPFILHHSESKIE